MKTAPPTALLELQQWPRWVVWRTEERDGKPTKVPIVPGKPSRRASSTDPETWGTYKDAAAALERWPSTADGIGYVFAADDEYAGVDLDKCVDDGKVHPAAWKIVERLGSYTELSPTGTGLHVIVRGRINGDRKRTAKTPWGGDFESYDQGRFFTVTGQHRFGTPASIEARQEELDAIRAELFPPEPKHNPLTNGKPPESTLDDVELLERIRKSKQGPKFANLFDRGAPENQESEADLGLCNILAFWLGPDPARIDSWFRRSALMREKWDDRRGETTYGGYTIDRALEGRTEFYDPNYRKPALFVIEGREDAVADSRKRAGELIGLDDDRTITGGRSWGRDLNARVEIDISDGGMLIFPSLNTYTAPAKINSLISFQIGGAPALTQATIYELFRHLRLICEFHEAVTLERKARDCGISFVQEALEYPAEMVNNQIERWQAMAKLAELDPVALAKASGRSIAAESLVINSNGTRYVRAAWFAAYARTYAASATAEQIVAQMVSLGWSQPGTEGRVKATQPNTGRTLNWAFFTVPEGWEKQ